MTLLLQPSTEDKNFASLLKDGDAKCVTDYYLTFKTECTELDVNAKEITKPDYRECPNSCTKWNPKSSRLEKKCKRSD